MAEESLILYKLMILYMLDQVEFPLTTASISDFLVKNRYCSFFQMQAAIHDLVDSEYIVDKHIRNTTNYSITPAGKEALSLFGHKVSDMLKSDIMGFLKENKFELRKTVDITAEYFPISADEYVVNTKIREKGSILMEMNINVVSQEQAITICDRWEEKSNEVYEKVMDLLLL